MSYFKTFFSVFLEIYHQTLRRNDTKDNTTVIRIVNFLRHHNMSAPSFHAELVSLLQIHCHFDVPSSSPVCLVVFGNDDKHRKLYFS